MSLNTNKDLKQFYSIGEVAAMFEVNETTLRFWEKEFPQIAPRRWARHADTPRPTWSRCASFTVSSKSGD